MGWSRVSLARPARRVASSALDRRGSLRGRPVVLTGYGGWQRSASRRRVTGSYRGVDASDGRPARFTNTAIDVPELSNRHPNGDECGRRRSAVAELIAGFRCRTNVNWLGVAPGV